MEGKDIVYNFLKTTLNENKSKLKYGLNPDMFFNIDIDSAKPMLSKLEIREQKEIVRIIENFNINQLSAVLENIRYNTKHKREHNSLLRDIRDMQKGRFLKKPKGKLNPDKCITTYIGFMRALNEGTLYTAKIRIDSKLKRIFIKTPVGNSKDHDMNSGFSRLAIDPETMNVYSFRNHRDGRINETKVEKVFSKTDLERLISEYNNDRYSKIAERSYLNFRKELLERIDAVYGVERIVDTYLRMGGKINPQKYKNPEFKEEMIRHLEEKFGTEKLLNWASKIKNPKDAAKLKLEILENLGKFHGKDYKEHYKREIQKARAQRKPKRALKRLV